MLPDQQLHRLFTSRASSELSRIYIHISYHYAQTRCCLSSVILESISSHSMSSPSSTTRFAPLSDAALRAFCNGIRFTRLIGATMDADLMAKLQNLSAAARVSGGPAPPEKELVRDPENELEVEMGTPLLAWSGAPRPLPYHN